MKDRLPKPQEQTEIESAVQLPIQNLEDEAIAALLALGYKPTQASQMVAKFSGSGLTVEKVVREALKASLG